MANRITLASLHVLPNEREVRNIREKKLRDYRHANPPMCLRGLDNGRSDEGPQYYYDDDFEEDDSATL